MSEKLAIEIFKQFDLEIDMCEKCPRKKEKERTCIGCLENAKEILLNYIEQLQQENEELKKINGSLQNALSLSRQKYNNDKQRYRRKYKKEHNILTEFEKWLEEKIKCTEQYADNDMAKGYINAIKLCKYYLQELKEGKK